MPTKKGWYHSEETKNKISRAKKGVKRKPFSDEWKRKIGKSNSGEKSHFWIDGRSSKPDYYEKHRKEQLKKQARKWRQNTKNRLSGSMSAMMRFALKGKKVGRYWESLVDYTLQDLVKHLENLFNKNMCWANYGFYWHIDHIKPQSLFHYETTEDLEFQKCWALENLQPLEKIANIKKGNYYKS